MSNSWSGELASKTVLQLGEPTGLHENHRDAPTIAERAITQELPAKQFSEEAF
jgi:hypothetical protein